VPQIRSQTHINATPEQVFDFIDDWRNAMRYMKRMTRWDLVDPEGGTGVGAEFNVDVQAGPRRLGGRFQVTGHDRPHRIAFRSMEDVRVEGQWDIQPDGDGTRLTLNATYDLPGGIAGRLVGAFLRGNAQSDLDSSVRELKRLVEAETT
jgi:carbon monoxide dehydrogenase subunit G